MRIDCDGARNFPNLNAPVTKLINCLLTQIILNMPNEAMTVFVVLAVLMPTSKFNAATTTLLAFARSEDHKKSEEYALKDCIECKIYFPFNHIPLIQYFPPRKKLKSGK